jgi:hypothetical protein
MSDAPTPHDPNSLDYYRVKQRYDTARTAIRWAGIVIVAYVGFGALKAFAGQSTSVAISLILNALVDLKLQLAIALTGTACAWAAAERILRLRKVESMQGRIKELETRLDPNRSSSGLTPRGQTNPRDRRI